MRFKTTRSTLLLALGLITAGTSSADDSLIFGFRGGFSEKSVSGENFQQYELFVDYKLPWNWQWSGWQLDTRLEGTAGALNGANETGFVGSIGPALSFSHTSLPLFLDLGVSPTVLSRSTFKNANLGGNFQFTDYVGIRFKPSETMEIGYRFQHMSNAGIKEPNPGLNMNMFQLGYHF